MQASIVIVGAGQGGAECAVALRRARYDGAIHLLGDETLPPYQRPPLSKDYLAGAMPIERLPLRSADAYAEAGISFHAGCRVAAIDRTRNRVHTLDGGDFRYDSLVLATGASARDIRVPGRDLANVFTLRSVLDSQALSAALAPGRRLLVIGAGYLGLEVAATARLRGCDVTVVEASARALARSASPALAEALTGRHRAEGTEIILGGSVVALQGRQGAVVAAVLSDGRELAVDAVLIAIGSVPETRLAAAAGLPCDNGVIVDADCRTSDPCIYAVGDCAAWDEGHGPARLESVQAAVRGAGRVASSIMGQPAGNRRLAYFWSTQFDLKVQIAGYSGILETEDRVDGDPTGGAFSISRYSRGRLVAVEAVNMPQAYIAAQQAIQRAG
jgi:3-phenylpropionate/trans-cinnamate dioxygenase ferredoxin reductase subunit